MTKWTYEDWDNARMTPRVGDLVEWDGDWWVVEEKRDEYHAKYDDLTVMVYLEDAWGEGEHTTVSLDELIEYAYDQWKERRDLSPVADDRGDY